MAYWALAEMVRMQAEIIEGEAPESARTKLEAAVSELAIGDEEQRWIEPRLAQLLGLDEQATHERDDLFAAWRLFFERMAEQGPAVLVFEDLQWADASLLEFIEYLLDWSRKHPLFVLALSRPELASHHSGFGAAGRNVTTLSLEALSETAMQNLLSSLVPGLPESLRDQILRRAEGVPLYAMETVRMLLDRGLLVREGEEYRPAGEIETLAVPETLHALLASRLDSLPPEERGLLQSAAVLGKTFTRQALAAATGMPEPELEPLLQGLVRKEVLFVQADPRSPERGQFGFLQDLLRRVAYDTLAKGERKTRHLAAARALEASFGPADPEIVEVLAAHYLAAYEAAPEAADAPEIRARTQELLAHAGQRAASLAAREEASRYFRRAAEFADRPLERARLLERAGAAAWAGGRGATARELFEDAIKLYEDDGETHPAARVAAARAEITWAEGHIDQAVEGMEASFSVLSQDPPDEDLAMLAAQLGRLLYFRGDPERAHERIERALEIAESLELPEVISEALNTKSVILSQAYLRPQEANALLAHSLRVALDAGIPHSALRAYYNLACLTYYDDELDTALHYSQDGLAYARRFGDRNWESTILSISVGIHTLHGEWDDALSLAAELPDLAELEATAEITSLRFAAVELLTALAPLYVARGMFDEADRLLERFSDFRESSDVQERVAYGAAASVVLGARGLHAEALVAALNAFTGREAIGPAFFGVKLAFVGGCHAGLALGQLERVDELLAAVAALTKAQTTPFLRAQAERFRGRLAAARGDGEQAETAFASAAASMRELGLTFWLAVTELEHADWLSSRGAIDEAEPLFAGAQELFEQLEAPPWLERVDAARSRSRAAVSSGAPAPASSLPTP